LPGRRIRDEKDFRDENGDCGGGYRCDKKKRCKRKVGNAQALTGNALPASAVAPGADDPIERLMRISAQWRGCLRNVCRAWSKSVRYQPVGWQGIGWSIRL